MLGARSSTGKAFERLRGGARFFSHLRPKCVSVFVGLLVYYVSLTPNHHDARKSGLLFWRGGCVRLGKHVTRVSCQDRLELAHPIASPCCMRLHCQLPRSQESREHVAGCSSAQRRRRRFKGPRHRLLYQQVPTTGLATVTRNLSSFDPPGTSAACCSSRCLSWTAHASLHCIDSRMQLVAASACSRAAMCSLRPSL